MSGESKKRRKRSEGWNGHSPAGQRGNRTVSCLSDMSMNSAIHSSLSPEARDTVLKLKKIPDPFSDEMQDIFDDFITHVDESTYETIDLSEAGLLLSGATKIYSAQVNMLQKWTTELAEFVTKTNKKVKEKKDPDNKEKVDKDNLESQSNADKNAINSEANNSNEMNKEGEMNQLNPEKNNEDPDSCNKDVNVSSTVNTDEPKDCDNLPESNPLCGDGNLDPNCKPLNEDESVSANTVVPEEGKAEENEMSLVQDVLYDPLSNPAMKSHVVLGPGPVTRKRLMCFKDLLNFPKDEPLRKKDKFEVVLPPKLNSCYEEMETFDESETYRGDENPPILEVVPPLPERRKRKIKEGKDEDKLNDKVETNKSAESEQENKSTNDTVQNDAVQSLAAASIPDFAPEDQSSILECINELHYLPFTFELSNTDLSMAFSKTVDRICSIFQKYNVPLSRAMIKAASAMCSGMVPNEGRPPNGVNQTLLKLNGIHETLIKNFGSVNVEQPPASASSVDDTNKEAAVVEVEVNKEKEIIDSPTKKLSKTIFESTEEKTVAQSRETIKAMIAEMQRSIVPKYARIPMMEENTPEFFQRVTHFEKKMRKVLDAEATKEEFDVRKYEMEVLESTTKETLEQEKLEDEIQVPLSPFMPSVFEQPSDDENTNDLDLNFQGCSSSRSSFEGSQCSNYGSRWVPLSNIFRHMKKLEKVEACRLFYAVLALLSYQNLEINYDQLYSEESARLANKGVDHEQDGKYASGMKILTSRCPDVDKGEVYIAALTAKSHTESFRELLMNGSNNMNNNDEGTNSSLVNGEMNYGIKEQKEAFVEEVGMNFSGQLFGKRSRKPKKAAPIPFIPFPLSR